MKPGRTPNWNVIADLEPTTWLEPADRASDDRLLLPVSLRKRVSWSEPTSTLGLLAMIAADGGVTVVPLARAAHELAAIRSVLASGDMGERVSLAFAAMATYSRISLQPDGRLRLSPTLALHLFPEDGRKVWVGAHGDAITLWSERDWATALAKSSLALEQAMAAARAAP